MTLSRRRRAAVALTVAAMLGLVLAACSSSTTSAKATPTTSAATGTTVGSATSAKFGTILVTSTGMTLYMNSGDSTTTSVCTSACTPIWPPLTTSGGPKARSDVKASLLGTLTRPDGSKQVTYNGHPLYTFVNDAAAGQVNGEGIVHFGGNWYVVNTSGQPVTSPVSPTAPTAPPTTTSRYGY
jgi:predicted lipoprotein with Yx(FWY)xxD motif